MPRNFVVGITLAILFLSQSTQQSGSHTLHDPLDRQEKQHHDFCH